MNRQQSIQLTTDDLRAYVQRIYAWMVGGIMLTGITAWGVSQSESLLMMIFGTPLRYVVMFAPLAMVLYLSARLEKMSSSTAAAMFIAFSLVQGMWFSSIFFLFELDSVFQVLAITAGTFAAAAIYGYVTKRDLTGMGSFMMMGLFGIIIASVVNIFMASDALTWAVSIAGVGIFTGLTAYDMQNIKDEAVEVYTGQASLSKRSIMSALRLYLNFINLFLFILRLLGSRK